MYNGSQIRQFSELKERAGVAQLREVLEDRLTEIKKARTWKHERVITSPQDRKVYSHGQWRSFKDKNNHKYVCNVPQL